MAYSVESRNDVGYSNYVQKLLNCTVRQVTNCIQCILGTVKQRHPKMLLADLSDYAVFRPTIHIALALHSMPTDDIAGHFQSKK